MNHNETTPGQPDILHMLVDLTNPVSAVKFENGFYCIEHGEWSQVVDRDTWFMQLALLEQKEGKHP